jgi:hypothetical protein
VEGGARVSCWEREIRLTRAPELFAALFVPAQFIAAIFNGIRVTYLIRPKAYPQQRMRKNGALALLSTKVDPSRS